MNEARQEKFPAGLCRFFTMSRLFLHYPVPVVEGIHPSPLCFAQQNIGERQRSGSDEERGWKDGI